MPTNSRQPWTSGLHGGRRPRAVRKERDTVRVSVSILRPLYEELCARERAIGIYRTQILSAIVSEELAYGVLNHELRAPSSTKPPTG